MTPQALIFDLDGTLADTMPAHYIAWKEALEPHGIVFPEDRFYACGGMSTLTIVEMLSTEQGKPADPLTVSNAKYEAFFKHLPSIQPIDPILDVAKEHHGKLPMAIATGGRRHGAEKILAQVGIGHLFESMVTADDVSNHKPHPETYLRAAELIGVAPENCRAFEDADPGIASARAAGMEVVDVREILGTG
ncbi:MAG: HAD-IA family hydrolase [Planctomycetota bacterium]